MKLRKEDKALLVGAFTVPIVAIPLYISGISLEFSLLVGVIAGIAVGFLFSR